LLLDLGALIQGQGLVELQLGEQGEGPLVVLDGLLDLLGLLHILAHLHLLELFLFQLLLLTLGGLEPVVLVPIGLLDHNTIALGHVIDDFFLLFFFLFLLVLTHNTLKVVKSLLDQDHLGEVGPLFLLLELPLLLFLLPPLLLLFPFLLPLLPDLVPLLPLLSPELGHFGLELVPELGHVGLDLVDLLPDLVLLIDELLDVVLLLLPPLLDLLDDFVLLLFLLPLLVQPLLVLLDHLFDGHVVLLLLISLLPDLLVLLVELVHPQGHFLELGPLLLQVLDELDHVFLLLKRVGTGLELEFELLDLLVNVLHVLDILVEVVELPLVLFKVLLVRLLFLDQVVLLGLDLLEDLLGLGEFFVGLVLLVIVLGLTFVLLLDLLLPLLHLLFVLLDAGGVAIELVLEEFLIGLLDPLGAGALLLLVLRDLDVLLGGFHLL